MGRLRSLLLSLLCAGLAACASLEPGYVRPPLPTPKAFPGQDSVGASDPAALSDWRRFFLDPKLSKVVELGLQSNRDLRIALLNVQAARAQYRIQNANLLPHLDAGAGALYERETAAELGLQTPGGPSGYTFHYYSANLSLPSYEVDLFGRLRSLSKSAFEQLLASKEARRAAQVSLVAEIAQAYLTLAADEAILKAAQETLTSSRASLALARQRFDHGVASELDVRQAETLVDQAQSDAASYAATAAQDRIALDLVVGSPVPQDLLPSPLDDRLMVLSSLPVGLPSEVLLNRPDVLQAEHALKAQNAQIGAARAAFFPSVTLIGSDGSLSPQLSNLFKGPSGVWSFEPQVTIPIFAGGANQANLSYAQTEKKIDVAQYEKAIQGAFRDVADALARKATIGDQVSAEAAGVDAAAASLRLSLARYQRGADTYLNVLIAQRTLYQAQQSLASARLLRSANLVTLYQALGGGADAAPLKEANGAPALR